MKKIIIPLFIFLFSVSFFGQASDYRTTEDGLNKLLSNPDFVKDVMEFSSEEFSVQKLDSYFAKYVPEYSGYKANTSKIDVNKLYLADTGNLSTAEMINKLGTAFKMKPNDLQNMQNIFMGNTGVNSGGLKNMMYDRGKDKKTDLAVDLSVDFFQRKFAGNKLQSGLMDIGGGLLGGLINKINQRYEQKMAEQAKLNAALSDQNIYMMGSVIEIKPEQQDVMLHHKADLKSGISIISMKGQNEKAANYEGAIEDYNKVIEYYKNNPDRSFYLYTAFVSRAQSKMQLGAYRAAVTDYYLAESVIQNILSAKLPDKSVEMTYPVGYFDAKNKKTHYKGKVDFKFGTINNKDLLIVLVNRAFAKYRLGDYTGAIADCKLSSDVLTKKMIAPTALPNDYRDIILAITAMSEFGMGKYPESYATFSSANLNDELISDNDNDGITDFLDTDKAGTPYTVDKYERIAYTEFYGLPNYFPFDISQIRGLSLYKANKIDEAIQVYENILTSEKSKYQFGNAEKKTFTKIGGDISAVYSTLSSFYYAKGDKAKAVSLLEDAIKINPEYEEYTKKKQVYDKEMGVKAPIPQKGQKSEPAKVAKKDKDYYMTKHTAFASTNKPEDDFVVLTEAAQHYPEDFFQLLMINVQELKSPAKAETAAKVYASDAMKSAAFNIVNYQFAGNAAKEEEATFAAFENGMNFYDADIAYKLNLRKKNYFCKLFMKYGSETNNNFFSASEDKAKTKRGLDSVYQSMEATMTAQVMKMMKPTKEKQYKRYLGTTAEYLKVLEDQENVSGSVPSEVMDRIEALIILKRNDEAIKFAKKTISKKKFDLVRQYIKDDLTLGWIQAVENIAAGSCGG